LIDKR